MKLLAGLFLLLPLALHAEGLLDEISPQQKASVLKGEQLLICEEIEGKPWPRVKIYQIVNASSEDVAAVFFDYEKAKTYIPNLLKSEVSKQVAPCVMEVDYGVNVPILADEYYTVRNTLSSQGHENYSVEWVMIRALQTKSSEGQLRIEPFKEKSIICYTNLVTPSSGMAGLLRGTAIEQMRSTVQAIVEKVESQKSKHTADLEKQVESMRSALLKQSEAPK